MIAPDIKFVLRNVRYLWVINTLIFAFIDIDLILLGPLFIRFYGNLDSGVSNFILHDGLKSKQPVNYPVFGYLVSLFVGFECIHQVHHEKPWISNHAKNVPGEIDLGYWMLKPFSAVEQ